MTSGNARDVVGAAALGPQARRQQCPYGDLMENSRMKLMFVQRTGLMSALLLAMYSCVIPRAHAFDSPKWGHDAATSEWFLSLKDSSGQSQGNRVKKFSTAS